MDDELEIAASLLEGVRLPPKPTIVVAISNEAGKQVPDFPKIAALLEQDPAMVAKVLKIINSPLFGMKGEVTSIRTALSLMGLQNFYTMVVTTAAQDALGFSGDEAEELWQHSLHVARLCQEIGKDVMGVSPEEAYLLGLFHDGAIPVLLTMYPLYKEIIERVVTIGGDITAIEEEKFNTHHAAVGAYLARSWGLPAHLYKAIRFHHADSLELFVDVKDKKLAAVLMLADFLARCVHAEGANEDSGSERWENLLAEIQQILKFDQKKINAFQEQAIDLAQATKP